MKMCFSGKYTQAEIAKKLNGKGGLTAYMGTNDMKELSELAFEKKDAKAESIFHAFTYQVSKEIGSLAAVLQGKVDQIILTGGIAYGKQVVEEIKAHVGFISDVTVYAGEDELLALAQGGLRVLRGEEPAMEY